MEYVAIIFAFVFFALFVGSLYLLYKAIRKIKQYEKFYASTIEDISLVFESIDTIFKNRPLLSDDPDVHRMIKGVKLIHGIVSQYANINNQPQQQE